MPRRGNNIYRRKDGRWEGRMKKECAGKKGANGGRSYISIYGRTYTEVKLKMEQMKKDEKEIENSPLCLEKIISSWMEEGKMKWKQSTYATYNQMANKYIIPFMGNIKVDCIDEQLVSEFLSDIRTRECGGMLSSRYLKNICSIILQAMKYAKKKYHYEIEIPENLIIPARQEKVILPKEQDLAVLEKYLLDHLENDTCLGILMALYTGLRIGELCGMTWGDINLQEEVIYVRRSLQRIKLKNNQGSSTQILTQTPKTATSLRTIPIPPILLPGLLKYKKEADQYVVMGKKKPWSEPRTLQYRFEQILKSCQIETFNFHMLRHTFASRCMERGFDVKSLSEILGHSNTQITLNLYVHSNMQHKKQLMKSFDICMYQSGL